MKQWWRTNILVFWPWAKCTCRYPQNVQRFGHETSCPRRCRVKDFT
jgi:hypothetical protein